MQTIIKPIGPEIAIDTANTVANNVLVRIINTGAASVLHVTTSSGTEYANLTVSNTEAVIISKKVDDKVAGTGMKAVPIAYKH